MFRVAEEYQSQSHDQAERSHQVSITGDGKRGFEPHLRAEEGVGEQQAHEGHQKYKYRSEHNPHKVRENAGDAHTLIQRLLHLFGRHFFGSAALFERLPDYSCHADFRQHGFRRGDREQRR